ncbi:MAG: hypothetical protein RSC43_03335 [Clostridia bacterium]
MHISATDSADDPFECLPSGVKSIIDGRGHTYENSANERTFEVNYPVATNGIYYAGATDKLGNTTAEGNRVPCSVTRIDKIAPTVSIRPVGTSTPVRGIQLIADASDPVDPAANVNGNKCSGINQSRYIWKKDGDVIRGETSSTYSASTNGKYTVTATDNVGNTTESTPVTINNIDRTPPTVVHTDPTISQVLTNRNYNGWTNKDVDLHIAATDYADDHEYNPPSGVKDIIDGMDRTHANSMNRNPFEVDYTITKNGTYYAGATDNLGNSIASSRRIPCTVNRIDKINPTVSFVLDTQVELGKSYIYVDATDAESGLDSVTLWKGNNIIQAVTTDYSRANPHPVISQRFDFTDNGIYTVVVKDIAGNIVKKTFDLQFRFDYYVDDFSIVKPADTTNYPLYDTPFDVSVRWGNRLGNSRNVPVELYTLEGGTKTILMQDRINLAVGSTQQITYSTTLGKLSGALKLYASIGGKNISVDLTPTDNTKELRFNINKLDYSIDSEYTTNYLSQGQQLSIPVTVKGTDVGTNKKVPVELYLDNTLLSTQFVDIGRFSPKVDFNVEGTVPRNFAFGAHNLRIVVNRVNMAEEVTTNNNTWTYATQVYQPDLRLKFDEKIVGTNDVFNYASTGATYTINLQAVNPNEVIESYKTLGKVYTPGVNKVPVKLELEKQQSQVFDVVVKSACETQTKAYVVTVQRLNDNLDVVVWCDVDGKKYYGEKDEKENQTIYLPTDTENTNLHLEMVDKQAAIQTVDAKQVENNTFVDPRTLTPNETQTSVVTVHAQDPTIQKTFNVNITNQNYTPSLRIVNENELNGTMYSTKGVLRSGTFTAYGDAITSVVPAKQSNRLSGIIIEVEVRDLNPEQYLRGFIDLNGVQYPIHWNNFEGPVVLPTAKVDKGYIYIDKNALHNDFVSQVYTVHVEDFMSDIDGEVPLSRASKSIRFGADVTGPVITSDVKSDGKTVTGSAVDSGVGLLDMRYSIAKDYTNWSNYKLFNREQVIPGSGVLYVRLQARDRAMNESVQELTLSIKGPETPVPGGVFSGTSRKTDFWYVNTRKSNLETMSQDVLNTFK